MQSYQDIGVRLENFVATVELQRPPHNFFDFHWVKALADAFTDLDANPDCRAIVLAAQGQSFCAGANFDTSGTAKKAAGKAEVFGADSFRTSTADLYQEAVRLFRIKKPIIAAVHGAAIGGGLGMALLADFRITCPEARFSANFSCLGIHPGFGLTITLPRLIGQQKADLLFYTGRRIKGEAAVAMGLADALAPNPEATYKAAVDLAAEIAANAPLAVQSVRATMRVGLADRIAKQTDHELEQQQWLRETEDAEEGIKAVAERRAGRFKGC